MRTIPYILSLGLLILASSGTPDAGAQPVPVGERPVSSTAFADLVVDRFTTENGLPNNTVVSIVQDSVGFVWFGTHEGLARFDGFSFHVFQHDPLDPTSISSSWAEYLYVDSQGVLWVGTLGGGLNRFDQTTERFTSYRHDPDDPTSLIQDSVTVILEDHLGNLWVGTHGGLDRFDRETGTFTHYRHDPNDPTSLSNNQVRTLFEDRNGTLWVGTGSAFGAESPPEAGGLNRFDRQTGTFIRYLHDPNDPTSLADNKVETLFEDSRGNFWVGTLGGVLNRMDRERGTFERFYLDPSRPDRLSRFEQNTLPEACGATDCGTISFIDEDASGVLWIGNVRYGLFRYHPARGVRHHNSGPDDPNALANTLVWTTLETRDGTRWIGNFYGGVHRVTERSEQFRHYLGGDNTIEGPGGARVMGLETSDDGVVWIATLGEGLIRFDPQTNTVSRRRAGANGMSSLSSDSLLTLYYDRSGVLWIGARDGTVSRFDRQTGRFRHYRAGADDRVCPRAPVESRFGFEGAVTAIQEGLDGNIWVGFYGKGLAHIDRESGAFRVYCQEPGDPQSLSSNVVTSLIVDRNNRLWVGTARGLNRFNPESGTFSQYHIASLVTFLYESRSGELALGTYNGGVYLFDPDDGTSTHLGPGLPQGSVTAIVEDREGRFWVGILDGTLHAPRLGQIARFDPSTRSFRVFTSADGLPDIAFLTGIASRTDGTLYFGGRGGFVAFDAASFGELAPPEVVFTGFRVYNDPVEPGPDAPLKESIHRTKKVELSHELNDFTIEWAALDYRSRAPFQYQYILERYDQGWVEARNQRSARYSRLAPGQYVFRVRAARPGEGWAAEGAAITITILPPWWRTWWAYSLYGLLMVGSVLGAGLAYRRRVIRAEQEKARERELQQAREIERLNVQLEVQNRKLVRLTEIRSRFFANISHEFRTPLTLLLGPVEDALHSEEGFDRLRHNLLIMQRNAHRLLELIDQLLDLARLESGSMKLRAGPLDLITFMREMVESFAARAEAERIALQFVAEADECEVYADPDKVEKIFSNLLANAFKFTPEGGRIRVRLLVEDGSHALVEVRDTGQGMTPEELTHIFDRFYQADSTLTRKHGGAGIGLALAKELVELHGGTIDVESQPGFGAIFTVRLPLGSAHLPPDSVMEAEAHPIARRPVSAYVEPVDDGEAKEPGPAGAPLVLVVEDHAELRAYIRKHLARTYRVAEAADGVEGLEAAHQELPDLVIADVMMPGMDGIALCRAIKQDDRLAHVPVILLTARADEESRLEGLTTGADDYLTKPFSMEELLVRVENLIELRRTLRQRFSGELVIRPTGVSVPSEEAAFLEQVRTVVEQRLGDSGFVIDQLADEMGLSRRHFHRRIKELTGLTPGGYIRMMRLERAAQLLEQRAGNVSEIAYRVGFQDPDYFSRLFKQAYGVSPSGFAGEPASPAQE